MSYPPVSLKALMEGEGSSRQEALDNLARSMNPNHYGFFVLVETSEIVPLELRRAYANSVKEFYALSDEEQAKYVLEGEQGERGATPYGIEIGEGAAFPDPKRFLMFGFNGTGHAKNINPPEVPLLKDNALAILSSGQNVGDILYEAFAEVAGIDPLIFRGIPSSTSRAIRYSLEEEELSFILRGASDTLREYVRENPSVIERSYRHTDIADITLVIRDEKRDEEIVSGRGLEVKTPEGYIAVKTENWHDIPGNIGNLFHLRTGWPSTEHRVGYAPGVRYSFPIFIHPPKKSLIRPLREEAVVPFNAFFKKVYGRDAAPGETIPYKDYVAYETNRFLGSELTSLEGPSLIE